MKPPQNKMETPDSSQEDCFDHPAEHLWKELKITDGRTRPWNLRTKAVCSTSVGNYKVRILSRATENCSDAFIVIVQQRHNLETIQQIVEIWLGIKVYKYKNVKCCKCKKHRWHVFNIYSLLCVCVCAGVIEFSMGTADIFSSGC